MHPFLRQGAPQWADVQLGHGDRSIRRAGCLLVALTQAARQLGAQPPNYSPLELNAGGKALGAFHGSNAIIPALARVANLQAPGGMRVELEDGAKALTDCLLATLESGWVALLRVDRDPDPQAEAYHWLLALALRGGEVVCADPASGRACMIDPVNLRGLSEWPSGVRSYEVTAVVPVGPAKLPDPA
jgi:hypothetical protein